VKRSAKSIVNASLILFAFALSSCSQIEIKDGKWCGSLGDDGAECVWMLSEKFESIPGPRWKKEQVGMVCTPARTFGDLKTSLLQFCKENSSMCSFASDDLKKTYSTMTKIAKSGRKK